MKTLLLIVLLLNVLFVSSKKKKNSNKLKCRNNYYRENCRLEFDFYVLSLQYKPGMCHRNNFCNRLNVTHNKNDTMWTIHGLWPTKPSGQNEGDYCLNNNLSIDKFPSNLTELLNIYWPSLVGRSSNHDFHNHEWTKHGSCISYCYYGIKDENAQVFYFTKVLELRDKYNPSKFIDVSDESIDFDDLISEFKEKLHTVPQLICKKDRETDKQILTEIRLSLDTNFNIIKDESNRNKSRCKKNDEIYFYL